ncbi:MAG TPA: hypothetical protein VJ728_15485 [Candidatus Binataceae bacterium]|nr:hypothetical protein [Candidatus Binataceae bacterium]
MADISNEDSPGVSETMELVDATGQRLNQANQRGFSEALDSSEAIGQRFSQATQRGASETIDRAEASGRRLGETAQVIVNDMVRAYETFFGFDGAKRIAQTYIDLSERMAKESLDFNNRFVQLCIDGARKFWDSVEYPRQQIDNSRQA